METGGKLPTENTPQERYFEFLADMGLTKHFGSMEATKDLVELCYIGKGKYVLDVGCGVGATPCYLAKTYNCRVVGVDFMKKMVEQSRERAKAESVEDRVEFRVADARDLPFEDDLFDAIIIESVNVFFKDKQKAINEYVRVAKPGGYVGITEMTWLESPLPQVAEYYLRTVYADTLEAAGWKKLLQDAGLKDVVANTHKVDVATDSRSRFKRYGYRGIVKALFRSLSVFFQDPTYREFMNEVRSSVPKDLLGAMGYGVYAGRKEVF